MNSKDFKPTEEMIAAAKAVFISMALVETIRPIVVGYQRKILETLQAPIADRWVEKGMEPHIITDPDHSYLMSESAAEVYHEKCNEERIKAGLKVQSPEYCPLLVAESDLCDAEARLIAAMEPVTNLSYKAVITSRNALENCDKMVDLTLRLLAPYIKSEWS